MKADLPFGWKEKCHAAAEATSIEEAMDHAARLLHWARLEHGTGCLKCSAQGTRVYPNTTTWVGGIGGQTFTEGLCDVCWGTGRTDIKGIDGRRMKVDLTPVIEQAKARCYTVHDARGNAVFVATSYREGWVTIMSFDGQNHFTEELFLQMLGAFVSAGLDAGFTIPSVPSASK